MRSFLGVPIVAPEGVIGAFYLTDKEEAPEFSDGDQALIELLAAHAAIAITNARLYEHSRELSMLSERNRLALELHDAVSQKLFSLVLTAEAAGTLLERERRRRGAARTSARLQELAREALEELRSLILELRPPELERDGLCGALRKHVEVLRRAARGCEIDARRRRRRRRSAAARDQEVLRIAQEALHNAVRHAGAAARRRAARARATASWCSRSPTTARASSPSDPERALAPARADLDGGARGAPRRAAGDPLGSGRGDDGAAGGGVG